MPVPANARERRQKGTIPCTPTVESAPVKFPSRVCGTALCLTALLAAHAAPADDAVPVADAGNRPQPLWEVGVGAIAGTVADYPASDRYAVRFVPFPYFIYRGRLFRSDENGARLHTDVVSNVELDVSGGVSFATPSSSSGPRAGMPDLKYLVELGPNLKITLARPSSDTRWLLELPVRAVISLNGLHDAYQGLVFTPDLGIHTRALFGSGWSAYASAGPDFASARYQQYFYQVDAQYALPDRPEYDAHGGYFGSRLELGASHKLGRDFRVFFFGRLDDYAGARNEDSPLYQSKMGYSAFAGISWAIWRSKESVSMPEENR